MKKFKYDFSKISKLGCRLTCVLIFIVVQIALLWRLFFVEPFHSLKEFFKDLKWRCEWVFSDYLDVLRAVRKSFLSGFLNEKKKVNGEEE